MYNNELGQFEKEAVSAGRLPLEAYAKTHLLHVKYTQSLHSPSFQHGGCTTTQRIVHESNTYY